MEDLIVLGLIPGTSIQIDFYVWLKVATVLFGFCALEMIRRRANTRNSSNSNTTQVHNPHAFVSKAFKKNLNTTT